MISKQFEQSIAHRREELVAKPCFAHFKKKYVIISVRLVVSLKHYCDFVINETADPYQQRSASGIKCGFISTNLHLN